MGMKNALLFILSLSVFFSTYAQEDDNLSTEINALFEHVSEREPGYMMAVIKDGKHLHNEGYGLANLEHQIPIDEHSSFNIASLSKQFTAAAIALMIIDEKLDLDDPVDKYLKDFPFKKDNVQIKHLIYMTSGINDYYYNPRSNGSDWSSLSFFNIDTAIAASYSSGELMYKPGTQWSYSNINYMLLTKIVESISGSSFADFVEERIFKPLDMKSVVNDDIFQPIPNRALAYNFRSAEETAWMIESGYLNDQSQGFLQIHRNSPHYGGSGIYCSMADYKKWIDNFESKKLGGQAFYDLMHKQMKFEHDKDNDAFGLVIDNHDDEEIVWYEGGDWGYSSFVLRLPKHKLSIVCFSNIGSGNARQKVWSVYDILKNQGQLD